MESVGSVDRTFVLCSRDQHIAPLPRSLIGCRSVRPRISKSSPTHFYSKLRLRLFFARPLTSRQPPSLTLNHPVRQNECEFLIRGRSSLLIGMHLLTMLFFNSTESSRLPATVPWLSCPGSAPLVTVERSSRMLKILPLPSLWETIIRGRAMKEPSANQLVLLSLQLPQG